MDSCLADIFLPGNTPSVPRTGAGPQYSGFVLTEGGEGGTRIITDLSAGNTFTSPVFTVPFGTPFAIAAFGTWSGTLSIEYSVSGSGGPFIVSETRTTNFYNVMTILATPRWGRIGFETGQYTSGTAHVMILQPPGTRIAIMQDGVQTGAVQLEGTS